MGGIADALQETRERTLALVAPVDDDQLERVHSTLMSPLVWDLGHIAAFEDLWIVHRYGDRPLLRDELMDVYDAFETPRAQRGTLPYLRPAEARDYLNEVHERSLEVLAERGEDLVAELVIRHEQQHCETMLQTLALARLPGYTLSTAPPAPIPTSPHVSGLEMVTVPAGEVSIGAGAEGFAYDNERPQHMQPVPSFRIGRAPVSNADYLEFVMRGGYDHRNWWSEEGWAWKQQYDITKPGGWTKALDGEWSVDGVHPLDPAPPVVHVSWFEADAFARAHDARLPTEEEWEKAATWDQERHQASVLPWGDDTVVAGVHANIDHIATGPLPVQVHADGASPYGCLGMIGDTWEWTSSEFTGYPGFVAHPYPEYSEVFFGSGYRVLRGGSWATRSRVITASFRNWDFPQRRQIFSGFRIARDLS
jgi:gamma-glutamyl hercynylcysteine S-oxide synthase